jgi:hypothetical protein
MNTQERSSLVYRIIQGKTQYNILGQDYVIYTPNLDILVASQSLYHKIINEYKYHPWIQERDCEKVLTYNGLWNPDMEGKLTQLGKSLEECKLEIFKAFFNLKTRLHYKNQLKSVQGQIDKIEEIKHSLDYLTPAGFAHILQSQFIVCNTVYTLNGDLLFPSFERANFSFVNLVQSIINEHTLLPSDFKDIVRNEPWSSMWRAGKSDIFPNKGVLLSGEQRNIILFSQMFDSIREHPEAPHDSIIEDDDALDGWMIAQKREREAKRGDQISKTAGIPDSAQEVFLPASSKEDIQRIESLNTVESKAIKMRRTEVINKAGEISDSLLPDQQMNIRKLISEQAHR